MARATARFLDIGAGRRIGAHQNRKQFQVFKAKINHMTEHFVSDNHE
jgi:hypothetical protein